MEPLDNSNVYKSITRRHIDPRKLIGQALAIQIQKIQQKRPMKFQEAVQFIQLVYQNYMEYIRIRIYIKGVSKRTHGDCTRTICCAR